MSLFAVVIESEQMFTLISVYVNEARFGQVEPAKPRSAWKFCFVALMFLSVSRRPLLHKESEVSEEPKAELNQVAEIIQRADSEFICLL
jgi:hypothetical protein